MDKDRFLKAMAEEFNTTQDIIKLDELLEEYSLLLQLKKNQTEIKDALVDFALDVIDLLELKENK